LVGQNAGKFVDAMVRYFARPASSQLTPLVFAHDAEPARNAIAHTLAFYQVASAAVAFHCWFSSTVCAVGSTGTSFNTIDADMRPHLAQMARVPDNCHNWLPQGMHCQTFIRMLR